jgi:hypothetical protein
MFEICQANHLKLSSTDLIRIVCPHCGAEEECPSVLVAEYEVRHHDEPNSPDRDIPARGDSSTRDRDNTVPDRDNPSGDKR